MLRSSVIEQLERTSQSTTNASHPSGLVRTGIAFFYCDGDSAEKQELSNIFGSLLKQLLKQLISGADTSCLDIIITRYKIDFIPSAETIVSDLIWIVHWFIDVYFIIDGIDECSEKEALPFVLQCLAERARVLVTSRPEKDLIDVFLGSPRLNIDEPVKNDIIKHVKWQMANHEKLRNIRPSLKRNIENKLVTKSAGM